MAVETQRSPAVARVSAARLREAPKELLAGIGSFARWLGGTAPVRYVGLALAPVARLARWLRLYEFMTSGPLIRFVSNSLQRRIIFANLIGLAILLGGIFYLNQRPSWLIEEKRDRLRTQGQMIAAAIAANASVETGRIMLDPERLPDIEGARSPFRDDAFAALQLSIAPERVTLVLKKMVQTADTRARVYGQDGDRRHRRVAGARARGAATVALGGTAGAGGANQDQERLDALFVVVAARGIAGVSRNRRRQRQSLSGSAHGPVGLDHADAAR